MSSKEPKRAHENQFHHGGWLTRPLTWALISLVMASAVACAVYYFHLGLGLKILGSGISDDGQHWGQFGDYFGGVVGTLVTCVSVYWLGLTFSQQREQVMAARLEQKRLEILKYLEHIERHLSQMLELNIRAINGKKIHRLVDVLATIEAARIVDRYDFVEAFNNFLELLSSYCIGIGKVRDTGDGWMIDYHTFRARHFIELCYYRTGMLGDKMQENEEKLHELSERIGVTEVEREKGNL